MRNKLIVIFLSICFSNIILSQNLPKGFVYLDEVIPNIAVELRYYSTNNFIGDTVDAYYSNRAIISNKPPRFLM